ncbi:hypothetical protein T265_00118 [Opisthorchis viverrini]|uniref:Uncharacterized protein n=1 Tax=Opisthorchis viverrini TaxID=6198 RepID=A0A075A3M5_OPIVI|nr:hypothetical protein T265_00118 [Opisthorchis viverrini]KER34268.1 hypothetical protein T265_00118 [Opisthorchis viverrini]
MLTSKKALPFCNDFGSLERAKYGSQEADEVSKSPMVKLKSASRKKDCSEELHADIYVAPPTSSLVNWTGLGLKQNSVDVEQTNEPSRFYGRKSRDYSKLIGQVTAQAQLPTQHTMKVALKGQTEFHQAIIHASTSLQPE